MSDEQQIVQVRVPVSEIHYLIGNINVEREQTPQGEMTVFVFQLPNGHVYRYQMDWTLTAKVRGMLERPGNTPEANGRADE
jgi:hypothetical protein